jgi:hypothetical protein
MVSSWLHPLTYSIDFVLGNKFLPQKLRHKPGCHLVCMYVCMKPSYLSYHD